jgi:dipeptidyl aminopeptidase/acylaminoacyl peptidase
VICTLRSVALLLLACTVASAATQGAVTLSDLVTRGEGAVDVDIAPQGTLIAYRFNGRLEVLSLIGKRTQAHLGEGIVPRWSPRSSSLSFYSSRSGTLQMWLWDASTGVVRQLTHINGGIDPDPHGLIIGSDDHLLYSWSPDGTRLTFASRVAPDRSPKSQPETTPEQTAKYAPLIVTSQSPSELALTGVFTSHALSSGVPQFKDGHTLSYRQADSESPVSQLFVVDVSSGTTTAITRSGRSLIEPSWSPDGRHIACAALGDLQNDGASAKVGSAPSGDAAWIDVLDLTTGDLRAAASSKGLVHQPKWSPDGSKLAYLSSPKGVEDRYLPQIDVQDYRTGALVRAGHRFDHRIRAYQWDADGKSFLISYYDQLSNRLAWLELTSETLRDVEIDADGPFSIEAWSQTRHGDLLWIQRDANHLDRIWYRAATGARAKQVISVGDQSTRLQLGRAIVVHWTSMHDEAMEGAVLVPPDFRAGHRYPVIVDAYPLIGGADWMRPLFGNQAWASSGFVVFRPGPRAPHVWMSGWKSGSLSRAGKGPKGWDVSFDDVMKGLDELVRLGIADPQRICLYGFSNGGSVVVELVSRTNRFKCAVVVSPALADWLRPMAFQQGTFAERYAGDAKNLGVQNYIALSPVFRLMRTRTPMIVAAGDDDGDPLLDAIEVFSGARRAGAAVTLLRYPHQGHVLAGAALSDLWNREIKFFDTYLTP